MPFNMPFSEEEMVRGINLEVAIWVAISIAFGFTGTMGQFLHAREALTISWDLYNTVHTN